MTALILYDAYLEVDGNTEAGIILATPAFWIKSLWPLYGTGERVGANLPMGGSSGRRARKLYQEETEVTLRLVLDGEYISTGEVATSPPKQNLDSYLAWVESELVDPPANTGHTRSARLHRPNGIRYADIQVISNNVAEELGPATVECDFIFRIPAGRFVESAS